MHDLKWKVSPQAWGANEKRRVYIGFFWPYIFEPERLRPQERMNDTNQKTTQSPKADVLPSSASAYLDPQYWYYANYWCQAKKTQWNFHFLDFFVCSGADFEIFRDERFSQEDHYEWFKDYTHFRHLLLQHMNSHSSVTFISCILIYALFEHQISVWICNMLNRYWSWDVGTLSCVKSCIKMGLLS